VSSGLLFFPVDPSPASTYGWLLKGVRPQDGSFVTSSTHAHGDTWPKIYCGHYIFQSGTALPPLCNEEQPLPTPFPPPFFCEHLSILRHASVVSVPLFTSFGRLLSSPLTPPLFAILPAPSRPPVRGVDEICSRSSLFLQFLSLFS